MKRLNTLVLLCSVFFASYVAALEAPAIPQAQTSELNGVTLAWTEMGDPDVARDGGTTIDMDMSAQHRALSEDDAVGDVAIMCNMGAGHQIAIAAQSRVAVFLFRSAVNGDILANDVSVAHRNMCHGATVTHVLWFATDDRSW